MRKEKKCKSCGAEISFKEKICPSCSVEQVNPTYKKWCFSVIVVFMAFFVVGCGDSNDSKTVSQDESAVSETTISEDVDDISEDVSNDNKEDEVSDEGYGSEVSLNKVEKDSSTESTEENIPTEYKSALRTAKSYATNMHMSKASIYDQLISEYGEKFSVESAQYAMDNLSVDWNENALKTAESYATNMHMSKAAIYDQLVSEYGEKFTAEEAQYAIDNVSADWKENALKTAKTYQDTMAMSPSVIYDQLVSEYGEKFTAEEAQYAIDNLE